MIQNTLKQPTFLHKKLLAATSLKLYKINSLQRCVKTTPIQYTNKTAIITRCIGVARSVERVQVHFTAEIPSKFVQLNFISCKASTSPRTPWHLWLWVIEFYLRFIRHVRH